MINRLESTGDNSKMSPITAEMQAWLDTPEEELLSRLGQARNDHPVAVEILWVLEFRRVKQQSAASAQSQHKVLKSSPIGA
jgi:hypothetical protein